MVLVTLVGEKQARVGNIFVFFGAIEECRECRLRNVCFNLESGRRYKVVAVRDTKHDCMMHENGVRAVEVEKTPLNAAVDAKIAAEGATVSISGACSNIGCDFYVLCRPKYIKPEHKLKIIEVRAEIKCPEGFNLKEVLLE